MRFIIENLKVLGILFGLVIGGASQATASVLMPGDTIKLDRVGATGGASGGGEFSIYKLTSTGSQPDTWLSLGVQTFCVEFNEHISLGEKLLVGAISDRAVLGGISGQLVGNANPWLNGSDPLDPRTQFLYKGFATGNLASAGFLDNSNLWSNALQQAIWYLEGEVSALTTPESNALYNYAQTYTGPAIASVFVLNLFALNAPIASFDPLDNRTWASLSSYRRQDQLFYDPTRLVPPPPVAPEPASGTLWLSAICFLACRSRVRSDQRTKRVG